MLCPTMTLSRLRILLGVDRKLLPLRHLTTEVKTDTFAEDKLELTKEENDVVERELELELKRNKSRLSPSHYNVMHGRQPYLEPQHRIHFTIEYQRKMFGRYGLKSEFNPGYSFMTQEELASKKEYESLISYNILEAVETIKKNKIEEKKKILQHDEAVAKNMSKMGQWMKELDIKKLKKEEAADEIKLKKERLIEEIRRHFGFRIDPKDERFMKMLEEKEKEQKKAEKIARKAAKEARTLLRLQKMNAEIAT